MSAFVLSSSHIDVLVSEAIDLGLSTANHKKADELGRLLWPENLCSVVGRYRLNGTSEESVYEEDVAAYLFRHYSGLRPVAAAEAAHC